MSMFTFHDKNSSRAFRMTLIDHKNHHTPHELRQERWDAGSGRFVIASRHHFATALDRQAFLNDILHFTRTYFPTFREKVESAPLMRTAPNTLELAR